jgi:hypothetical protein
MRRIPFIERAIVGVGSGGESCGAELENRVCEDRTSKNCAVFSFSRKIFTNLYDIMILTMLLNVTRDLAALCLLQISPFISL